ncbi:hypothetical protein [Streptomyces dysideae]|uniref:Uncharacterized protein n=1 Tax=Streptomyces dysideae TaxID=909626 RepID=A0A101UQ66_9ACTN|nr:hypothetical protein [Streptomyces dysideae]KUO14848.1 hypothetical protein AQJ91_44595 [Streptomyces dysideae]
MDLRGRRLKFTVVTALVVLALTGFSTGRGHGSSSSSGGSGSDGGGGCSSSSRDHDSSSSTSGGGTHRDYDDDDDDDYGSSSGSASTAVKDAQVKLVSCVTEAEAYATVAVTNPNSAGRTFTVTVRFLDADSNQVDLRTVDEFVAANETTEVQVPLDHPGLAAEVDHCDPELYAAVG